jgi:hypothetical protein
MPASYMPEERYRIYRRRGRTLTQLATAPTAQAMGLAVVTLHEEGEWDDRDRVGVIDGDTRAWVVNPFVSGDAP